MNPTPPQLKRWTDMSEAEIKELVEYAYNTGYNRGWWGGVFVAITACLIGIAIAKYTDFLF